MACCRNQSFSNGVMKSPFSVTARADLCPRSPRTAKQRVSAVKGLLPFCPSLTLRDFSASLVAPNCALSKPRKRGLQLHSVAAPLSRKSHGFARVLRRKLCFGRNDKRGTVRRNDKRVKPRSPQCSAQFMRSIAAKFFCRQKITTAPNNIFAYRKPQSSYRM